MRPEPFAWDEAIGYAASEFRRIQVLHPAVGIGDPRTVVIIGLAGLSSGRVLERHGSGGRWKLRGQRKGDAGGCEWKGGSR